MWRTVDVVCLDFSKAFDTICCNILMNNEVRRTEKELHCPARGWDCKSMYKHRSKWARLQHCVGLLSCITGEGWTACRCLQVLLVLNCDKAVGLQEGSAEHHLGCCADSSTFWGTRSLLFISPVPAEGLQLSWLDAVRSWFPALHCSLQIAS